MVFPLIFFLLLGGVTGAVITAENPKVEHAIQKQLEEDKNN